MKILENIEETQECKENKNQYLTDLKHHIREQKEKISRADKSLQNAQKSIQRLYESTGDKTVLIQQVCKLHNVFYSNYKIYYINLSNFTFNRKR